MYEVRVVKKKNKNKKKTANIYKYLTLIFIRIENPPRVEFLWRRRRILDRHKYRRRRLLRDI